MLKPFKNLFKFLALPYIFVEFFATWGFVEKFGLWIYFIEFVISALIGVLFISRPVILMTEKNANSIKSLIFSSFGYIMVGILFLIPGIFCDILALIIAIVVFIVRKKYSKISQNRTQSDIIIDGEIIEEERK